MLTKDNMQCSIAALAIYCFPNFFINFAVVGQNKPRNARIGAEQLKKLVREELGSKVKAAVGIMSEPTYLFGDFNGDGYSDIAVMVLVEEGRDELKSHGVNYLDVDPYSRTNGRQADLAGMGQNCLGVT